MAKAQDFISAGEPGFSVRLPRFRAIARGLAVTFQNVHHEGNNVVGDIAVNWTENIFGTDVTLIDGSVGFSFQGRIRIYENEFYIGPMPVDVYLDLYVENFNKVCAEARAVWWGGNVGDIRCHDF